MTARRRLPDRRAAMTFELECISNCADCGVGTLALDEWYMVKDEVWGQAWAGRCRHKIYGQEILCIGCLEGRIGRTLCACDFTDCPINDPDRQRMSARLCDRVRRVCDRAAP